MDTTVKEAESKQPTLEDWLVQIRSDMAELEPLECPNCNNRFDQETLKAKKCSHCSMVLHPLPRIAKYFPMLLKFVVVSIFAIIIYLMLGEAATSEKLAKSLHWLLSLPRTGRAIVSLIIASLLSGMIKTFFNDINRFWSVPTGESQRFAATNAQILSKSSNSNSAARWYAEMLSYGYSESFYISSNKAFEFIRGHVEINSPLGECYWDLLFCNRLIAWYITASSNPWTSSPPSRDYTKDMLYVVSDSPRLIALAQIIKFNRTPDWVKMIHTKAPQLAGQFSIKPVE